MLQWAKYRFQPPSDRLTSRKINDRATMALKGFHQDRRCAGARRAERSSETDEVTGWWDAPEDFQRKIFEDPWYLDGLQMVNKQPSNHRFSDVFEHQVQWFPLDSRLELHSWIPKSQVFLQPTQQKRQKTHGSYSDTDFTCWKFIRFTCYVFSDVFGQLVHQIPVSLTHASSENWHCPLVPLSPCPLVPRRPSCQGSVIVWKE